MRLVAVSKILDEADIVEAFIRHSAAYVDHHLVMDNGSRDGTLEILQQLAGEGLPLTIMQARSARFREEEYNTALYRYAAQQLAADWVAFLDADEFIDDRGLIQGLRADLEDRSEPGNLVVYMRNYLRTVEDGPDEPVVPLRQARALPLVNVGKVIVDTRLGVEGMTVLGGAHQVMKEGRVAPHVLLPGVILAHYPERSTAQAMIKYVRGWMKVLAGGPQLVASGASYHYGAIWETIRTYPHILWDGNYGVHGVGNGADMMHVAERDPIIYRGGPLRYTPPPNDPARYTRLMLDYIRDLAESHGRLVEGAPDAADEAGVLVVLHPVRATISIRPPAPATEPEPPPQGLPPATVAPPRQSFFRRLVRR